MYTGGVAFEPKGATKLLEEVERCLKRIYMFLLNNWRLHRKCWELHFSTGEIYPRSFILEKQACQFNNFVIGSDIFNIQLGAFSTRSVGNDVADQLEGKAFRSDDKSIQFGTKGFRSNDNLGDLLSRIRNGYFRSFEDVIVIDSKQNRELLDAFIYAGYIHSWKVISKSSEVETGMEDSLQVSLKYFKNIPAIRGLQQISRPGKRTYINTKRILKYSTEQNWGENKTLFLATSKGIFNHREIISGSFSSWKDVRSNAKRSDEALGSLNASPSGEALCLIW